MEEEEEEGEGEGKRSQWQMRGMEKKVKKTERGRGGGRKEGGRRERGKERGSGGREALTRETFVGLSSLGPDSWLQICGSGSHTVCGMVFRLLPALQTPQTVSHMCVVCSE